MSEHPLGISRQITERWVIEGQLVLTTPTHLGKGDTDAVTDMPLLMDEATGNALLPGTSLAGALRNYLRERALGYGVARLGSQKSDHAVASLARASEKLFGGEKGDDEGAQSSLIVDDALGNAPKIELRDGVRIDPLTHTAWVKREGGRLRGSKFDLELLEAGTTFGLRLELLVSTADGAELRQALAIALDGLAHGQIMLGMRKRRGFGCCMVPQWTVTHYDLCQPAGLLAWLAERHPSWASPAERRTGEQIAELLGVNLEHVPDRRHLFCLQASFQLESSLLIRSGFGQQDQGPDTVHLHARQAQSGAERQPVLSGTSLAGALRGRAMRIARTLAGDMILPDGRCQVKPGVTLLLNGMFGPDEIKKGGRQQARASRLIVHETMIQQGHELVQNRIRVDRFTGGAYESALFSEQPVFGYAQTQVTVDLALRSPTDAEIGLLLLLLKDLWTGDLPLGGEASVGRGRLHGLEAQLELGDQKWRLKQTAPDQPLQIEQGEIDALNQFVAALRKELVR